MVKKLSFLFFLGLTVAFAKAGEDWQPFPIGPFGTLNNRDNSYAISNNQAQDLLNIDITPGGKSVRKRKGYGQAYALTITTNAVHGTYNFFDSNGNSVSLFFNDRYLTSSIGNAAATVIYSTGPLSATYQCTDSLGFAYCANTSRTTLIKTNGVSASSMTTVASTGSMVAACPTRLAMAGFAEAPSRIDFSADSDFTTWGSGSLGPSAAQFTINAPGAKITHIVYAFNRLMWFKDTSFGYILIGNQPAQSDWVIKTVAYDVGTNDNTSIYREGILYFRGKDSHIYAFDGTTYYRLTREIAATINLTQFKTGNSWTQTTQSDWIAGSFTTATWLTTNTNGDLFLSTSVASISSFTDTNTSDFVQGTLTNTTTTLVTNGVTLSLGATSQIVNFSATDASGCSSPCSLNYYQAQLYTSTDNFVLYSLDVVLKKTGSPSDITVRLLTNNAGVPGTLLDAQGVAASSVGTSAGTINVVLTGSVRISSGTSYWIQLVPGGTCDASNKIEWFARTSGYVGSGNASMWCGSINPNAFNYGYSVYGKKYATSGTLVSRSFDITFDTSTWYWNWTTFSASSNVPTGTTLSYSMESATSATGSWQSLTVVTPGNQIDGNLLQRRYFRYTATFSTTDRSTSSILNDVTINISDLRRPSATFRSQIKNAPNLSAWDALNATKIDNGGTHTFYIRSATNPFTVNSATPSFTVITLGAIPTITTGTYFQIRDDFAITNATFNPILSDFTQNWYEGNATDKSYAIYFDDKLWWAVSYGAGSSTNNRILLYDLLNKGWLAYDLASDGFYVHQNHLYFGSSSAGYIYKFGDNDSDNGSAINAYWKSKDYFGADPFTTQELANISVVAKSVANSTMTVTYSTNSSITSSSFTIYLGNSNNSFVGKNKNLPAGSLAPNFNIQIGNNAADQPFEVFGIQVGIRPKSWIPTP